MRFLLYSLCSSDSNVLLHFRLLQLCAQAQKKYSTTLAHCEGTSGLCLENINKEGSSREGKQRTSSNTTQLGHLPVKRCLTTLEAWACATAGPRLLTPHAKPTAATLPQNSIWSRSLLCVSLIFLSRDGPAISPSCFIQEDCIRLCQAK